MSAYIKLVKYNKKENGMYDLEVKVEDNLNISIKTHQGFNLILTHAEIEELYKISSAVQKNPNYFGK